MSEIFKIRKMDDSYIIAKLTHPRFSATINSATLKITSINFSDCCIKETEEYLMKNAEEIIRKYLRLG